MSGPQERTYPRKWFRVGAHSTVIHEKEFLGETAQFLSWHDGHRVRRDAKRDTYGTWYPTREEAQEALDEATSWQRERETAARIRDAAPDLLEAWEEWFKATDQLAELERNSDTTKRFDEALYAKERAETKAKNAIARVRGDA